MLIIILNMSLKGYFFFKKQILKLSRMFIGYRTSIRLVLENYRILRYLRICIERTLILCVFCIFPIFHNTSFQKIKK